jgi:hypothetical protein
MTDKDLQNDVHGIDKRLVHIEAMVSTIKDNHLCHIETDMATMRDSINKIESRIFYGVIAFFAQALLIAFGVIGFLVSIMLG